MNSAKSVPNFLHNPADRLSNTAEAETEPVTHTTACRRRRLGCRRPYESCQEDAGTSACCD